MHTGESHGLNGLSLQNSATMYEEWQPWAFEMDQTLNCGVRVISNSVE